MQPGVRHWDGTSASGVATEPQYRPVLPLRPLLIFTGLVDKWNRRLGPVFARPEYGGLECLAGAPVLGDAAQWVERIAQGTDTLKQHALQGYSGGTGYMPAKGGRADLSDAEVDAAVDYMIGEAQ